MKDHDEHERPSPTYRPGTVLAILVVSLIAACYALYYLLETMPR